MAKVCDPATIATEAKNLDCDYWRKLEILDEARAMAGNLWLGCYVAIRLEDDARKCLAMQAAFIRE